jgi:hypothetical protein
MTLYLLIENKPEDKVTASRVGRPDIMVQGSVETLDTLLREAE